MPNRSQQVLCLLSITVVVFFAFLPSLRNSFVNWDDPIYLVNNPSIQSLSFPHIREIFTGFVVGNYQPLTMLTFALEYHFSGLNPFVYHLTNLALHLLNTNLVFIFIVLLSRNVTVALLAALLFGIHPMRVESVAWITERKDVLFAFFYFAALITYLRYLSPGLMRQRRLLLGALFILFILSLLSKPSALSFPLALILIDYYTGRKMDKFVFMEKIPFFLISLIFGLIALYASATPFVSHIPSPPRFSFIERIFVVSHAIILYGVKLVWPFHLSAYYPYPEKINGHLPLLYYVSFVLVLCVIASIGRSLKSRKSYVFGLSFFFATIIFNLPMLSVGFTIIADRFSYVPYVGLFFILSEALSPYGVPAGKKDYLNSVKKLGWIVLAGMLFVLTWNRCRVWQDSYTLWSDVIVKQPTVATAYYQRADDSLQKGFVDMAIKDYTAAINLNPSYYAAFNNRGNMYFVKGQVELALADYDQALRLNPDFLDARLNKAAYYVYHKEFDRAIAIYDDILKADPGYEPALQQKKQVLEDKSRTK